MQSIPTVKLNNEALMPQLGLGVWQANNEEAEMAVSYALTSGYRLIDTARAYDNESGVGRAIARTEFDRRELFVTTKLWNSDQGYDQALRAFDASLERLGLDYLDLYLIHWPMPQVGRYVDTWRALENLYADGRIRAIGVSNFQVEHLKTLAEQTNITPAANQIEVHPDYQQRQLRDYCAAHGIQVESWSPLGGAKANLLAHPTLTAIAAKHGKSPAQIALRWHIQNSLVVIPKSTNQQRIVENADVFDFVLDTDDIAAIDALDSPDNRHGPDPNIVNLRLPASVVNFGVRHGLGW